MHTSMFLNYFYQEIYLAPLANYQRGTYLGTLKQLEKVIEITPVCHI